MKFLIILTLALIVVLKNIQTQLGYSNRYLEEISKYLRIDEQELNSQSRNVKCGNCSLIYKKKWFKKIFRKHF